MVHLKMMCVAALASLSVLAPLARCEPEPPPPLGGPHYHLPHRPRRPALAHRQDIIVGHRTQTTGYSYNPPSTGYLPPAPFAAGRSAGHGHGHGHDHDHGHGSYEHGHEHDNEVPKSYEFGYSVKDAASGNDYGRRESSDGSAVRGEYRVRLPDGRTQIVTYYADWQSGFHADVRYEGEAQYPEPAPPPPRRPPGAGGYGYSYDAPPPPPPPSPSGFRGSLTGLHPPPPPLTSSTLYT